MTKPIILLAIETSCDETAASILAGSLGFKKPSFSIISSVVKSQIALHSKMGGVVPEVAARAHVQNILPVTNKAVTDAKLRLADITHIAVTTGPGLIASLLVGVEFAKGLATSLNLPLLPINHMEGHLYSPLGTNLGAQFPILSLIVSGGHTLLVLQKNQKDYTVLGSTVDDAAGEAFDKAAKLLHLPYPGGPQISKLAEKGSAHIPFPRPMINSKDYNFSFAGLKTAVRYYIDGLATNHVPLDTKKDIARSFEEAVCEVLVSKAMRAARQYKCKTLSLSGGVAANKRLRSELKKMCKIKNLTFIVPDVSLCTDNAGMIALAAYFQLRHGKIPQPPTRIKADAGWEIQ